MINFLIYFYYRITLYYSNQNNESQRRGNSFITFCFAMIIHQMTLEYFLDSLVFHGTIGEFFNSFDKNTRRFIYAPLVTLPVFLIVYFYNKKNKKMIDEKLKFFQQESVKEKQRGKKKIIIYIVCSLVLLVLAFTSSKWKFE